MPLLFSGISFNTGEKARNFFKEFLLLYRFNHIVINTVLNGSANLFMAEATDAASMNMEKIFLGRCQVKIGSSRK